MLNRKADIYVNEYAQQRQVEQKELRDKKKEEASALTSFAAVQTESLIGKEKNREFVHREEKKVSTSFLFVVVVVAVVCVWGADAFGRSIAKSHEKQKLSS